MEDNIYKGENILLEQKQGKDNVGGSFFTTNVSYTMNLSQRTDCERNTLHGNFSLFTRCYQKKTSPKMDRKQLGFAT